VQLDVAVLAGWRLPVQLQDVLPVHQRRVALLDADGPRPHPRGDRGVGGEPQPAHRLLGQQEVEERGHQLGVLRRVVHGLPVDLADHRVREVVGQVAAHPEQQLVRVALRAFVDRDHGVYERGVALHQHGGPHGSHRGDGPALRPVEALADEPA
jgi:hypothetical protein